MNKLDSLNPDELMAICSAIAIHLSHGRTPSEINVLSSMAMSVGSLLSVAGNQKRIFEEKKDKID